MQESPVVPSWRRSLRLDSDFLGPDETHEWDCTDSNNINNTGNNRSYALSETAFRCEGVTIGRDFFRMQGVAMGGGTSPSHATSTTTSTATNENAPPVVAVGGMQAGHIVVHEIIGRGAFSIVRRGQWTRRRRCCSSRSVAAAASSGSETIAVAAKQLQQSNLVTTDDDNNSSTKNQTGDWTVTTSTTNVAIKEWSISESSSVLCAVTRRRHRHMLLQELRALCATTPTQSSSSPALVQLHGAFLTVQPSAVVTVVLEYMDRGSLQAYLENQHNGTEKASVPRTGLCEPLIAAIAYQMLTGLAALHERRLLHRDLKPANVLLHSNGAVKLCDFGLSTTPAAASERQRLDKKTTAGNDCTSLDDDPVHYYKTNDNNHLNEDDDTILHRTVLGTAQFMAPERLRAQPYGRSSDIWSFGLIVWQCITGQTRPFFHSDGDKQCESGGNTSKTTRSRPHCCYSMVDLLVTMEEMTVTDLVHSHNRRQQRATFLHYESKGASSVVSTGLQEILTGCLQVQPGKYANRRSTIREGLEVTCVLLTNLVLILACSIFASETDACESFDTVALVSANA